jgi:4-hydroxyacetophenone monooxygenase
MPESSDATLAARHHDDRERAKTALADEARLRVALREADIVPLLLLVGQLTGEDALLERASKFITGGWSFLNTIPEPLRDEIRDRVVGALRDLAAGHAQSVPKPSPERFRQLLSYGVGETLPELYAEAMLEEWPEAKGDLRSVPWRKPVSFSAKEQLKVAIIGAGASGICLGAKLREAGIPFTIYEKNPELGGTWFENSYPGCAVDIPNAAYSFSFAPNPDWSREFSGRDELWAYLKKIAADYDVTRSIEFNTEVVSAAFEEDASDWRITVKRPDGSRAEIRAPIMACAVGQLNRPSIPNLPGLDRFRGRVIHTAQWDQGYDLAGKRVALIGTGASAMQVGPSIAPIVARLAIFQRSPAWVAYNPNYLKDVSDGMRWCLANIPFLERWHRFLMWWAGSDALHPVLQKDPSWPTPDISLNQKSHELRGRLIDHIRAQVGDDPELLAKVIPTYPPYGKRMLRDNNWYKTLKRDNVDLIASGIAAIDETGITDGDGKHHPLDAIILATGFHASRMLWPVEITGRGGKTIRDLWGDDDPRAYMGMTVPGFPNMFVLYGPNTNLSHGGSIFFHAECQTRHILLCLRELIESGKTLIECKQAVHDAYNQRVDAAHEKMIWTHGGMNTWYRNKRGRVTTNSPWRIIDYWAMTRTLNKDDYVIR